MVTVSLVKDALSRAFSNLLSEDGYKLKADRSGLKKKIGKKSYHRIFFNCYDYKPFRIEFNLFIFIKIEELHQLQKSFYAFCGEQFLVDYCFLFRDTDLDRRLTNIEKNMRQIHEVYDEKSLHREIEDCVHVAAIDVLPFLENFSTLQSFQKFVPDNYELILNRNLVIQGLLALKIFDPEEFLKFQKFAWNQLELETKPDEHIVKKMVRLSSEFAITAT